MRTTRCMTAMLIRDSTATKEAVMTNSPHALLLAVVATFAGNAATQQTTPTKRPPNVLFVAIDDLRPDLGCYGNAQAQTPNLDRFAKSGIRFTNAYCQQSVCGPSRASIMTGMRPDTSGVHGNHVHFRKRHPDVRTIPQWFKEHGYHTQSMGKIYHGVFPPGSSITVADTFGDAPSWSAPTFRPGPRYYYTEAGMDAAKKVFQRIYKPANPAPDDWTKKLVFGPATEAPAVADNVLYDGQVAERAVATLQKLARQDTPFFLAVGFIKPHSPYIAPKQYWDLYDPADIALASDDKVHGAPKYAGHGSGELRRYTDQPRRGVIPDANQRRVRHAYLACTSYIDAQLGMVLDELQRLDLNDNTVVVIWSDHGYHLGEVELWGKTTNRELDTRVVLMARTPSGKQRGMACNALVELVDVYPSLVAMCGLPQPEHLEGNSFAPLLDDAQLEWKEAAFSQFTRGKRRGYSVRTRSFRYTEWLQIKDQKLLASELYDHRSDGGELRNIAGDKNYQDTVTRLSMLLRQGEGWRDVAKDHAKGRVR